MQTGVKQIEINRVNGQSNRILHDVVSIEEPLEIRIVPTNSQTSQSVSVTMRTPGADKELALGFLFTENILNKITQVSDVKAETNTVTVYLNEEVDLSSLARNFYTTSSCGVCGKASIDAIHVETKTIQSSIQVNASLIKKLPTSLLQHQNQFQTTGGIHASALFNLSGDLIALHEDVGRHNALDKLIGTMFIANQLPLDEHMLLVSGRASFELIQKAAKAGIPIVAAIGAPSSLAVELALEKGITLIGFLKLETFNIYSHPNRINHD